MISDVLAEAVNAIRGYLENPVFARCYQGALRGEILRVVAQMDRVREHLDTPPAHPAPDKRHENSETVDIQVPAFDGNGGMRTVSTRCRTEVPERTTVRVLLNEGTDD